MRKKVIRFSAVILLIDQIVKTLIINFMNYGESVPVIKDFFHINYVRNDGAAWNILSGNRYVLIMISILFLYASIKYFLLDENITKFEFVGYGLIIGGVLGNLVDRIVSGYVIDYLAFNIFGYNFPVFNIADIALVIGTTLIIINTLWLVRVKKK